MKFVRRKRQPPPERPWQAGDFHHYTAPDDPGRIHPEGYAPPDYPWYRPEQHGPIPTYCPKCGRSLTRRSWTTVGGKANYIYLACDGPPPGSWFQWMSIGPERGHWTWTIGTEDVRGPYDPLTGKHV